MHRVLPLLIASSVLSACSSARDTDTCAPNEAVAVPIAMPAQDMERDLALPEPMPSGLEQAVAQVDLLATSEWTGSRSKEGHARLRCWYDQEPDTIGQIVSDSIEHGLRRPSDWIAVADSARHDAAKAAILTAALTYDTPAALPRWMALMSGDGHGLHVSALKTLAVRDDPAVMATVIDAVDVSGYPGDGLMGAPFKHNLQGWAAAQRSHYWSVVWPTYWLLGLGAPDDTSVVDRVREVYTVGEDLKATERYIETLEWLPVYEARRGEEGP